MLSPSGLGKRTYALIGQGLIDRMLSMSPEELRTLFEEAAGITAYQMKRASALRRLEASEQNLTRVQDIIAEISPRLGYLAAMERFRTLPDRRRFARSPEDQRATTGTQPTPVRSGLRPGRGPRSRVRPTVTLAVISAGIEHNRNGKPLWFLTWRVYSPSSGLPQPS